MARPIQDKADFAAECWAYQWVCLFARDPRKASEYVGRLNSTLGLVRIMADGAASAGAVVNQHFPEVFLGDGLIISCLIKRLTDRQREWLFRHYVDRWYVMRLQEGRDKEQQFECVRLAHPVRQKVMASRMGISEDRYYEHRRLVKLRIFEALPDDGLPPQVKSSGIGNGQAVAFGQVR